ncbi:U32 family peptidase [Peptococcaceae bacterium]|nr:U32 family peptidase [Peptococcaceae bacterium]MCL0100843.1 U32 family peptidase [Peptococcaceae bacterium]
MQKPELLAPAGDIEKLKTAIIYGADAVYLGGQEFSLRAGAKNFDISAIAEGVEFAHKYGKKVYVAVNIFAHNEDLLKLPDYIKELKNTGIDAVIISDPGVINFFKEIAPELELHLSTQANTTNWASALFWKNQGVKRIVLARELSLDEIKVIAEKVDVELEVFVHGAMCMAYSGRCLLSNYLVGRDANRGDCIQPCRWRYKVIPEGYAEEIEVYQEQRGTYFMSSRDLCLIEHIPELISAGIRSFKIEGRMKSIHYVSTIVKCYRYAIDSYFESKTIDLKYLLNEISKVSNRQHTTGFIFGKAPTLNQPDESNKGTEFSFVGIVRGYDKDNSLALVEQRGYFAIGDTLEVMQPKNKNFEFKLEAMYDTEGNLQRTAPHPKQMLKIAINREIEPFNILRRVK